MDWWKLGWLFTNITYLNFSRSSKISRRAPTNARGVLGRVQERPGVPQGVQKSSSCQCNSKISRRYENCRPSSYKRLGGPWRGPGTPGGSLGESRNRRDSNTPFSPSSQCRCTAFSILNSRMQGTGFAGSSHSRIQNRKGRASLHCSGATYTTQWSPKPLWSRIF